MVTPLALEGLATLKRVADRTTSDGLAERLARLRRFLVEPLEALEQQIEQLTQSEGSTARTQTIDAAEHLLSLKGKRLRAISAMLAAEISGEPSATALPVAVAVELIHAATLLHDDVIDEGDQRRGQATAHTVYGNCVSILAGDQLLVEALQRIQSTGHPELMQGLLTTLARIVNAEARQLDARGTLSADPQQYLDIVDGKTATLFQWAFAAGAQLSGADLSLVELLQKIGRDLGIAFQIIDDVLDFNADPTMAGKDTLNDLSEGKMTWPVIEAARLDSAIVADLELALSSDQNQVELLEQIAARIIALGAVDRAREFATEYAESALKSVEQLVPSVAVEQLRGLIWAAIGRIR